MCDNSILVASPIPSAALDRLRNHGRIAVLGEQTPVSADELRAYAKGATAIICFVGEPIDETVLIAASDSCKVVASMGTGTDNIDISTATRLGIQVTNAPGVLTETTADLTFALILSLCRRVRAAEDLVHSGLWGGIRPMLVFGNDVWGKTLGIIGSGRIGTAVARRGHGFGMPIIHTARRDNPEMDSLGARRVSLDDLLSQSDIVSIHVPLTPETHHLIGARQLALMKNAAYLINTARGPVVDEAELINSLQTGQIAGAGLDVFEHEPNVPSQLIQMENVVCLPHIGSATAETRERMALIAADNAIACMQGRTPPNPVN